MFLDDSKFGFADGLAFGNGFGPIPGGGPTAPVEMEFVIKTTLPNQTYGIESQSPTGPFAYNNYDVDWGDASTTAGHTGGTLTHVYAVAGTYTIKITGKIYLVNSVTYGAMMYEFKSWGSGTTISGIRQTFNECINCEYTATDAPNFDFSTSASTYTQPFITFKRMGTTNLNVSNWNTSAFTGSATECFALMSDLQSLNFSNWDLTNVTGNALQMLNGTGDGMTGCDLTAVNVTWGVDDFTSCFINTQLNSCDVRNWTLLGSNIDCTGMFRQVFNPNSLGMEVDLSGWTGTANIEIMRSFMLTNRAFKKLNLTNWDVTNVTNMFQLMAGAEDLQRIIGLNGLRADSCTNMDRAFSNTQNLKFDLDNFHPDFGANWSASSTYRCFYRNGYAYALASRGDIPEVSNWDMSLVTDAREMFREAKLRPNSVLAPTWDLSNCSSLLNFYYLGEGIQRINFTNVTITNTMTSMQNFAGATGATYLELDTVDFGANCVFSGCTTWQSAFADRGALVTLNLDSGVDFSGISVGTNWFLDAPLATADYDNLLVLLSNTAVNTGATLTANLAQYTIGSSGETARLFLTKPVASGGLGWTVTDNGGV